MSKREKGKPSILDAVRVLRKPATEQPPQAQPQPQHQVVQAVKEEPAKLQPAQPQPSPPRPQQQPQPRHERLPHGSTFAVSYSATTETWAGTLTIPRSGLTDLVLSAERPTVIGLITYLDKQYRKVLKGELVLGK